MRRLDGQEIEFRPTGDIEDISPSMKSTVFRIVQELLGNACLHSNSEKIRLEMIREKVFCIEIEDWGVGFDPANVSDNSFGLRKIRERASLVGGQVIIDSALGKGTRIVVELPISNAEEKMYTFRGSFGPGSARRWMAVNGLSSPRPA